MSYLSSINSYETTYNSQSTYKSKTSNTKDTAESVEKENTKTDTSKTDSTDKVNTSSDKLDGVIKKLNEQTEKANTLLETMNSYGNSSLFNKGDNDSFNNLMSLTRDFSMMKSGSYFSILKNYYSNMKDNDNSSVNSTIDSLVPFKNDSQSSSSKLQSTTLLELKDSLNSIRKNENSIKLEINSAISKKNVNNSSSSDKSYMDGVVSEISKFADNYNSMVDKASNTDSSTVLNNILSMTKMTRYNAVSLQDIGVKLGNDNKLTVDKDALKNADLDKINSLFGQNGSFGDYTASKAMQVSSLCASEAKSALYGERYSSISEYL